MTYVDDLISARDAMAANLKEVAEAGPKPSYTWNKKQVNWTEYMQAARAEIAALTDQIVDAQETEDGTDQEYVSYGI